jgi:choline-sulfatase
LYNVRGTKHTQLFDLRNDPWEMKDLAGDPAQVERIGKMTEMLKSMMAEAGDPVRLDLPDWGMSR